ncbi:MAG TPA: nuclear transport factor 2 family protein [Dehalococcoidia bacterium]|nr:nuclear transport factor 2 family protein [Dehalococcoidia bacterium]
MADEALAREFTTRFVRCDVPGLVDMFTPNAVYHDVFYGTFEGHDAIRGMFETFFQAGKDYVWEWTKLIAGRDAIAGEGHFGFTSTQNGKVARFDLVSIFEVEGGKIAGYREYFDFGRALLQTGVDPAAVGKIIQRRMDRGQ